MKAVALKEVCRITNGGTPKSGVESLWHGGVPWLTPAEMGKRSTPHIAKTARTISEAGLANSSAKLVAPNSVILSTRAPIGHLAINDVPMAFNQGCRGLTPYHLLDTKYLYYFLYFNREALDSLGTGTTFKELSSSNLANFQIPLPPLDEQRRIVAVLDKAFAGIATATANAQKNLANARELFESYLESIFKERGEGWKNYEFEEVCQISSKLVDPRLPAYLDLPHIGAGNMGSKTGAIIEVLTAREEGLKSGKFLFDASMVLYSKIRPYLMKACRPDFEGLCSADVYPLVPKDGILERNMLFHILMSKEFTAYAEAGSARAGMPKVNREHLFKYSVWLPDVAKQREISIRLDELTAKCQQGADIYQRKVVALAELKQSLLQKAFAGELSVAVERELEESAT